MARFSDQDKIALALQSMTQTAVAKLLGVSRKTIYRYMRGDTIPPERHSDVQEVFNAHKNKLRALRDQGEFVEPRKRNSGITVYRRVKKDIKTGKGIISPVVSLDLTGLSRGAIKEILSDIWSDYRSQKQPFYASIVYSINLRDYSGEKLDDDLGIRQSLAVPCDDRAVIDGVYRHRTPTWFISAFFDRMDDLKHLTDDLLHVQIVPIKGAKRAAEDRKKALAEKRAISEQKRLEREARHAREQAAKTRRKRR